VASRPRYFTALVIMVAIYLATGPYFSAHTTRMLLGWDAGLAFFILSMFQQMYRCKAADVPRLSAEQDIGQHVILLLTVFSAFLSFMTIAVEIKYIRNTHGWEQAARIAMILGTILLSWCFVQLIFALHYAHHYFVRSEGRGLAFPGPERALDYGDFLYFSFTIGSAFATSDVSITTPAMRRTVTAHTVLSFFFNTFILGLWVNVGAGLL